MTSSPCFLIVVMLTSICDQYSFLQECCSVFVLCENVRLGDGYADDKHLSRVSLTCFIMRTHIPDIYGVHIPDIYRVHIPDSSLLNF